MAQLQAQFTSANASLKRAMQNVNSASSSYQSGINSAVSNYKACVDQFTDFVCTGQAFTIATNALRRETDSAISLINTAKNIFNQIIGTSTASIQSLQNTVQETTLQISNISNTTLVCLSQVANNAAANATATAQNATTSD